MVSTSRRGLLLQQAWLGTVTNSLSTSTWQLLRLVLLDVLLLPAPTHGLNGSRCFTQSSGI